MLTKTDTVYTKNDLLAQLETLQMPKGGIVLVHSSLRLIGKVEGGGKTVLDALIEHFTKDDGLLCIPTHTWNRIGKEITLDLADPKTCLGALSDLAAADERGLRSENPTHSMVVFGDRHRAEDFVKDELHLSSGTDPKSCYGKIYREGGHILLVGVSHSRNTYLHAVEEIIGTENRLSVEKDMAVRRKNGEIIRLRMRGHHTDFTSDVSARFPKYETAFRYHGAITDGFLGNAPVQACDAVLMKETMERILQRSNGEDPLKKESQIPPTLYY